MSSSKKNFYAVLKGRKPGIYLHWSGGGGAKEQIDGYPGAVYRGFSTREEAAYYLRTGGEILPAPPLVLGDTGANETEETPGWADYRPELTAGKVIIFTDGASTGNPGPGGYGVVLLYGSVRKELSGGFRCTTNNRMELMGVITALKTLTRRTDVIVYSDSSYVVNGIQKGWARRWKANGWLRAPDAQGQQQRAENVDLWAQLLELLDQHTVEFRWVRGHANHPENERCDRLAVQAARGKDLPPDPGFTGTC